MPAFDERAWQSRREPARPVEAAQPAEVAPVAAAAAAPDDIFADSWLGGSEEAEEPEPAPSMEDTGLPDDDLLASLLGIADDEEPSDLAGPDAVEDGRDIAPMPDAIADIGMTSAELDQATDVPGVQPFSMDDWDLTTQPGPAEAAVQPAAMSTPEQRVQPEAGTAVQPFSLDDWDLDAPPAPPEAVPEPAADADEAVGDVRPFSLDDWNLDEDVPVEPAQPAAPAEAERGDIRPFSLDELGLEDEDFASLPEGRATGGQPAGIQPFSLDEAHGDAGATTFNLDDRETAVQDSTSPGGQTAAGAEDLGDVQPFFLDDWSLQQGDEATAAIGDTGEDERDDLGATPFSLDELSLDEPDETRSHLLAGPEPDDPGGTERSESGDFTWHGLNTPIPQTSGRQDDPDASIFNKLLRERGTQTLGQQDEPSAPAGSLEDDLGDESFFSMDDVGLSEPLEDEDTTAEQPAAGEDLPFSLRELGLADDQVEGLSAGQGMNAAASPAPLDDEDAIPFSLADLGLSEDQDRAPTSEAAARPDDFGSSVSLDDFESDEALLSVPDHGQSAAAVPDRPAGEELESLGWQDQHAEPATSFSLADLGLSEDDLAEMDAGLSGAQAGTGEPAPFSFEDLGLNEDDFADLDLGPAAGVGAEVRTGEQEAPVEPGPFDEPPAELLLSDEELAQLDHQAATGPSSGGDAMPRATEAESSEAPVSQGSHFALADLGLTDEELELFGSVPDQGAADDASAQPVSGLSDEWQLTEGLAAGPEAPPVEDDTAFSLSGPGLDEVESAALDAGGEMPDRVEAVTGAGDADDFSMAGLGLSDAELAAFDVGDADLAGEEAGADFGPAEVLAADVPEQASFAIDDIGPSDAGRAAGRATANVYDAPEEPVDVEPGPVQAGPATAPVARPGMRGGTQPQMAATVTAAEAPPEYRRFYEQLEAQPENHAMRLAIARLSEQKGDIERALEQYRQLIRRGVLLDPVVEDLEEMIGGDYDPSLLRRLHRLLGDAYTKQDRIEEAMEAYSWT